MLKENGFFFTDAQLKNEIKKCEYCEEKGCTAKCPANCSPMDFIKAIECFEKSDFKRAAALIYRMNPLGGVCGMVCPDRHCMSGCARREFDASVNIPDIQSTIIEKAYKLNAVPIFKKTKAENGEIAIVGGGPAGIAAAATLASLGYYIHIFEQSDKLGGACNLIPDFRLPKYVLERDINFALSLGKIKVHLNKKIKDINTLLEKNFNAIIIAAGLQEPIKLGIKNEKLAIYGTDYLKEVDKYNVKDECVAIVGGGATATDCALTALKKGAKKVYMFSLEKLSEMPLTAKEMKELIHSGVVVEGRTKLIEIMKSDGKISGIKTKKVDLKEEGKFSLNNIIEIEKSEVKRNDITKVIIAIGNKRAFEKIDNPKIYYAGDFLNGPTTVVEAIASGKNIAYFVDEYLTKHFQPVIEDNKKSFVIIKGYNEIPISLETDFFGRKITTPFLLSAAPPSDGLEQMKKAYLAGWSGGVMKTAFDNVPIHIPAEYMFAFNDKTYANCDNVSGHPLDRVCSEIEKLIKEFPDRLTIGGTGGPVTGNDESDKKGWQNNTKKLENAGAMAVEYSLSCPQG
ncbi:MAG TPA: FAD-dependent oxidoreductase, partial [bacterium]|nr:FAD-dependent oxidoreductase [bacterium]